MIQSRHRLGYSTAYGIKDSSYRSDPLGPHIDDISAISFSEDGKLLLSSSTDSTAKLWKTQSGKPAVLCRTLDHPEAVSCISCSPIEHGWRTCKIATAGGDGKLRIWDFSLDSTLGGANGATKMDPPIKEIPCHDDVMWCCAFNPINENNVSTCSSDGTVKTWDITTGECVATYEGHEGWVTAVSYNRGATLLCSVSKDKSVRLWDAARPGRQVMELWGHESWVTAACFTPNSASLFSASHDKTVRQWDLATGMEVARLHGHAGPVQALDVSSDGLMMATTSWDGTCRLWSLRMRKLLCVLPLSDAPPKQSGAIGLAQIKGLAVSISPHGHVAVGGNNGVIKDFFAPPAVNKSLTDTREYSGNAQPPSGAEWAAKLAGKGKEAAPIGWVVDMILNLHQEDTQITEFMGEHCTKFKMDYRVGKATQEQHDIHQGYVDRVLNFMEEACDGLSIDPDDFVRALTVLARREEPEAQDLVLQMDAVEDFPLFFSLMSLRRIENHVGEGSDYASSETSDYESSDESDEEEKKDALGEDMPPLRKSKADPKRMRPGTTGQIPGSRSGLRSSKKAVQGLLETNYIRQSLASRQQGKNLAVRLSQRDIRTSWERQATAVPKEDGHWEEVAKIKKEKEEVEQRARAQEQYIKDLEKRVADSEKKRAALHNKVQELRGNIRVFCRVRPMLPSEDSETAELGFDTSGDRPAIDVSFMGAGNRKQKLKFDFDCVFRLDSTQKAIFKEVEPLLQSVMDGYKVCIFAYGQTGSGKTFTMEGKMVSGSSDEDDNRGVVPRCMQRLLAIRDEMKNTGDWEISLTASAVEIYNENIRDLLSDDTSKKHDVLTDAQGETYVSEATVVPVATEEEIYKVVRGASSRRETASTARNATSSRSHQVLQIRVLSKNVKSGQTLLGIMNMVDLAGSERITGAHDEARIKEAQNINKSLSCLLGVITAIATKQSHVPFRNTKLTHLLQSSLSGHGKAIMFANVSPLQEHVNESVNTFRFATQVSSVQLGTGKHQAHTAKKKPAPAAPAVASVGSMKSLKGPGPGRGR